MKSPVLYRRLYTLLTVIILTAFVSPPAVSMAAPSAQAKTPRLIDLTISLHSTPTGGDRTAYENIIKYFADGVYEMTNGAHKIRTVSIFSGGRYSDRANILWVEKCQPNASPSGYAVSGLHVNMCDVFDTDDFLVDDNGQQGGGYVLSHEWGHYFYSLYDEYTATNNTYDKILYMPHSTDKAVPNSIMDSQWYARGGHFDWLNFSTNLSNTKDTAQHRVYGASGWETLTRPVKDDPRDGDRKALAARLRYEDLDSVAPAAGKAPAIDLPGTARSDLKIVWVGDQTVFQIILDHSSSMEGDNKIQNARIAAKMLVDLAVIGETTLGVIQFDDTVEVVQPLTLISSQDTKNSIKNMIDTISPDGTTAIGDAAQLALDNLLQYGSDQTNRAVFLLTDGQSNTGVDPLQVIPAYQNAHVPLYIFGYGYDVNAPVLQQMAGDTDGKYYFSPTALTELTQVFQDASQAVSPSVGVLAGSAVLPTSSASSFPLWVDASLQQINIVVTYPADTASVQAVLYDPQGAASGSGECDYSGSETLCYYSVAAPAPGQWTLQAQANLPDITFTYRVSAVVKNITYAAALTSLTGDVVQYPDPIVLLAVLGRELPIGGAVVSAAVQAPDGRVSSISFRDDGLPPDAVADDGLYSAILDYSQDGSYYISIQFDNSAGGAYFTALSYAPSIGSNGEVAPLPDPIPVGEQFQRSAHIQVNVAGYRSDDHGNTPSEASRLTPDNSDLAGRIDYVDDVDVFIIPVDRDGELVVRVANLALGMDPTLRILGSDMTSVVAEGNLDKNASSRGYLQLFVTAKAGETLYAEVSHRARAGSGFYDISAGSRIFGDSEIKPPLPTTGGGGLGIFFVILALVGGGVVIYVLSRQSAKTRRPSVGGARVASNASLTGLSRGAMSYQNTPIGDGFIIGRGSDCQIRITDKLSSRQHACLRFAQDTWYLQDLKSTHGTWVNGQRITATALKNGDRVRIGATEFEFRFG